MIGEGWGAKAPNTIWGEGPGRESLIELKTWKVSKAYSYKVGISTLEMRAEHGEYLPDKKGNVFKYMC